MVCKAVINGNLVTPYRIITDAAVLIKDDRIIQCGTKSQVNYPADSEIIDAMGQYIMPGFIDIHCHGGGGCFFYEEPDKSADIHLKHGTTGLLATMVTLSRREELVAGVKQIMDAENPVIIGINMEGPYMNSKYGARKELSRLPDAGEYNELLKIAGDRIKIWTVAPELDKTDEFIDAVAERGIILSIGHSEADLERILEVIPRGFKLGCHCMCATGITPEPKGGVREVGVDEAVMMCDELYAEVIPDSLGTHVRPLMLKLLLKLKGIDKTIIVSDATRYGGKITSALGDDVFYNELGRLSGSKLTMNYAVRNMMRHTGIGLVEAVRMASLNPAVLLGIDKEAGSIEKGKKANIVIATGELEVRNVIFQGNIV